MTMTEGSQAAEAGPDSLEPVIGLEVHVQLRTPHKLFCADSPVFGAPPNTHVCPVCLGLPGALPVLNPEAVRLALMTAIALECEIHETSIFARKNYFYPDLPKGYQISQFEQPLATAGIFRTVAAEDSSIVRIRRIHMEEDAGKSLHDRVPDATAVDLNRAGTPLVEIVTEPDIQTPSDARVFLQRLRQLLLYLDVSDCNMEEGSLRVDANVSVRPVGAKELGTKTELKNMNSFSGIEKALSVEIRRQKVLVASGGRVVQESLIWDEASNRVRSMRSKEESHDYRYFPDPDLPPLRVAAEDVATLRDTLPELPDARSRRLAREHGLSEYDLGVLTRQRAIADYFESLVDLGVGAKEASNWIMGPMLRAANERDQELDQLSVGPEPLAALIGLVEEETISRAMARTVLGKMLETGKTAVEIVEAEGLAQISGGDSVSIWVSESLEAWPAELARYRSGEVRLIGFFMGDVMKRSTGRADPKRVRELLAQALAVD